MEQKKNLNIFQKLFEIQKNLKTFSTSEDSEKKNSKGQSEYQYTPGHVIVEAIREKMDALHLMLLPDFRPNDIRLIDYPVYKLIKGIPTSFIKKEVHIVVEADFIWMDVDTQEKAGPFHIVASGANGTDKSTASALALAERYFLLKFFHITTHDKDDEPDAHDSGNIPGISAKEQPLNANSAQAAAAAPVTAAPSGYQMNPSAPQRPQYQSHPSHLTYQNPPQLPAGGVVGFDLSHPMIQEAVSQLMNFDKGTPSHQQILNEYVGKLSQSGFRVFDPNFLENLTELAQAKRENRQPVIK